MCFDRVVAGCAVTLLLGSGQVAGTPVTISAIVLEGDLVPGVGRVTRIDSVRVNDCGDWLVQADTDASDRTADAVLVRAGVGVGLREGQPLAGEPVLSIGWFDEVCLAPDGAIFANVVLDGTGGTREARCLDGTRTLLATGVASAAPELSPGTLHLGFGAIFATPDRLIVVASVDDPAIDSSVDRAVLVVDRATGAERVLYKEGDRIDGELVNDLATSPHAIDVDADGRVVVFADLGPDALRDGAIVVDGEVVAREGDAAPVAGRRYQLLCGRPVAIAGSHVAFRANLDGASNDDEIIVLDGRVLVREGDTLPAIAPHALTGFGAAPLEVDAAGNVLWFGDWDDTDTTRDTGLFLNGELLVQEGVTEIDGIVVERLATDEHAFAMSPGGRFVVFEATLADGRDGAFLLERFDAPPATDLDGDGATDVDDLERVLRDFGIAASGDVTCDGVTDLDDVHAILRHIAGDEAR